MNKIIQELDQDNKGYVDKEALQKWAKSNDLTFDEAHLLIKRFDKKDLGTLNHLDLQKIFTPHDHVYQQDSRHRSQNCTKK